VVTYSVTQQTRPTPSLLVLLLTLSAHAAHAMHCFGYFLDGVHIRRMPAARTVGRCRKSAALRHRRKKIVVDAIHDPVLEQFFGIAFDLALLDMSILDGHVLTHQRERDLR